MAKLDHGALEARVMDLLWNRSEWTTPAETRDLLCERGHDVAYTTVMTVLTRLWRKERLERRKQGRAYAYRPSCTREEYAAVRMGELLDACGDRAAALSHLVRVMDADDKAAMRGILRRRR